MSLVLCLFHTAQGWFFFFIGVLFFAATFQEITFGAAFPQMPSSRSGWWVPSLQHHPQDLHF